MIFGETVDNGVGGPNLQLIIIIVQRREGLEPRTWYGGITNK